MGRQLKADVNAAVAALIDSIEFLNDQVRRMIYQMNIIFDQKIFKISHGWKVQYDERSRNHYV